jgi:hypothetical protein
MEGEGKHTSGIAIFKTLMKLKNLEAFRKMREELIEKDKENE